MSYKLLRLLLSLVGVAALGGFGWTFYDFIQKKGEYNNPLTQSDLTRWQKDIPPAPTSFKHHLPDWLGGFDVTHKLNVWGYVKPVEAENPTGPPPPPPPRFSESDVTVAMIIASSTNPGAYLIPAGAEPDGALPEGDFYSVGDKIRIPAKQNAELKIVSIESSQVTLATLDDEDSFSVQLANEEVDSSNVLFDEAPEGLENYEVQASRETRTIGLDEYEIGTEDLEKLQEMTDDQVYSAVNVQPARDALQKVRGLRITKIQSGTLFERVGLKKDDVVLSVNGIPAVDRADLLSKLRNAEPTSRVSVEIERRGGRRSLSYRVPR